MKRIALVAYGSDIRCDDAAAIHVQETLRKHFGDRISYFRGYNIVDLINIFPDFDKLILVDAAFLEQKPGDFMRQRYEDVNFSDDTTFSHDTNFKKLIPLARDIGHPVPEIIFYLIQPKIMEVGEHFSDEVRAALPLLSDAIQKEIDSDLV